MKSSLNVLKVILCLACLSVMPAPSLAQDQQDQDYEAQYNRAVELVRANKFQEASPILEKLYAARPKDAAVMEYLAYSIFVPAMLDKDSETRRKILLRARSLAEEAKKLGRNTQLIQAMLEHISEKGEADSLATMQKRTPAENELLEGEGAFAKGEMESAIEHYEKAYNLDQKCYEAPLFIGDAYLKLKKYDKAYEAYARAVAIDPDRDTAYRFWGDALMQENKLDEAKEKFIEGIIAAPYTRAPWQYLGNWSQRSKVRLSQPKIDIPSSSVQVKADNNAILLVDPLAMKKEDGTDAWTLYGMVRASWMTGNKFSEAFPNEKKYRHSLREESESLGMVAENLDTRVKKGELKETSLNVSFTNLLKLRHDGLIDAFILLTKPDEGISHDYAEYRKNNRDKLRQYLKEYIASGK